MALPLVGLNPENAKNETTKNDQKPTSWSNPTASSWHLIGGTNREIWTSFIVFFYWRFTVTIQVHVSYCVILALVRADKIASLIKCNNFIFHFFYFLFL